METESFFTSLRVSECQTNTVRIVSLSLDLNGTTPWARAWRLSRQARTRTAKTITCFISCLLPDLQRNRLMEQSGGCSYPSSQKLKRLRIVLGVGGNRRAEYSGSWMCFPGFGRVFYHLQEAPMSL